MTWPTSRPGYPMLPEDPGERAIFDQRATQLGGPMLAVLSALEAMQAMAPQQGSHGKYLAVMVNEVRKAVADLDAAVQAERDAIAEMVGKGCLAPLSSKPTLREVHAAIRSRGPTSALDAALAKARAEGLLAAAEIVKGMRKCPFDDPKYMPGPSVPCPVCGDKGDDPNAEVHCNSPEAAIRSAAAGEEGK